MSETVLSVVDLFCGAGGFTTGLVNAVVDHYSDKIQADVGIPESGVDRRDTRVQWWLEQHLELTAVNHADHACETFRANHPYATVLNTKVQSLHPPDAVDNSTVDILIGGPSCVPHSRAKGGMASDDQKRHGPRHVAHYLELLRPDVFCLENVPPFRQWGPLDFSGENPKMEKNGALFDDWVETLRTLGYTVDWDTFVASDYGVPQSRKRLFIKGRLNHEPEWPEPTHSKDGEEPGTEPHKTAASIIEWDDIGESLWTKSRPLVKNTNRRIAQGIREYGHEALEPFADAIADLSKEDVKQMQADTVPISEAAEEAQQREEPFLVEGPVYDGVVDEAPSNDVTTLCPPEIMHGCSGGKAKPAHEHPVPTVTAKGGVIHFINPETFILPRNGKMRGLDSNPASDPKRDPLHTVTAKNHDGRKFDACLIPMYSEREGQKPRTRDTDRPLMTVPAKKNPAGISAPYLVKYYGQSKTAPIDESTPTVTTRNSLALCVPEYYPFGVDVRYRMLNERELARAQGFPDDYDFVGSTKAKRTELIGNAVPVGLGEAMTASLLKPTSSPTLNKFVEGPQPTAVAESTTMDD